MIAAGLNARRLRPLDPVANRQDAFDKANAALPTHASEIAIAAQSWSLRFEMLLAEPALPVDFEPTMPNEFMRERGRLVRQGVSVAQHAQKILSEFLSLQDATSSRKLSRVPGLEKRGVHRIVAAMRKPCVEAVGSLAETLKLVEGSFSRHEASLMVSLSFMIKSSLAQLMPIISTVEAKIQRLRKIDDLTALVQVCSDVLTGIVDATDVLTVSRQCLLEVAASAFVQPVSANAHPARRLPDQVSFSVVPRGQYHLGHCRCHHRGRPHTVSPPTDAARGL
jgi:hypothetical protein